MLARLDVARAVMSTFNLIQALPPKSTRRRVRISGSAAPTPLLAVADYADDAVIVDADVFRGVGRRGDGVIGMVAQWSSR